MSNIDFKELRKNTAIAIASRAKDWGNEVCSEDYILDHLYRELAGLPPLPEGNLPLVGFFPPQKAHERLFCGKFVPETQLRSHNYVVVHCPILGQLTITGGFMEAAGHSYKSAKVAIFGDGTMRKLSASHRNLGIDYVTPDINAWYDGKVIKVGWERGYGYRCHVLWDVKYEHSGQKYAVTGAFAHAESFNVKVGDRVVQGQKIGVQGCTGGNYPPHIDYRQWISMANTTVDLSPNALEVQLHGK